jgi:hypothetical protein
MSDMTGDPTWDGGWEDGVERGDSLEQWILDQTSPSDDGGRSPGGRASGPKIPRLSNPDD